MTSSCYFVAVTSILQIDQSHHKHQTWLPELEKESYHSPPVNSEQTHQTIIVFKALNIKLRW